MKAEDLKKLKLERDLTTKQISELSGIPESTISRILSGQTDNPSFDTISAIVKAMGGSLDQMTGLHAASDNNDTTADLSPLITLYERVVAEKNRYIKLLVTISCVLVGILVFILLFDITNGAVGFIRY